MTTPSPRTRAAEAIVWARENPPLHLHHLSEYASVTFIHASRYAMNMAGGIGSIAGQHELAAAWWEASNLLTQRAMRAVARLRKAVA